PRPYHLAGRRELAAAGSGASLEPFTDRLIRGHPLRVVAVRNVDAAVGPDDDVVRLVELTVGVARLARDAETEELLALRTEFVDLVSFRAFLVAGEVGDPHAPLCVHMDTVWRH